jgi:hypothetical protein
MTAATLLQESLELSRKLDDSSGIASRLITLAEVVMMQGDTRWAATLLEESLPLARLFDHPYTNAWALNHLGHLAQIEADYTHATQLHIESLTLFRQYSEQHDGTAWALHDLGESMLAQNNPAEAREWLEAHSIGGWLPDTLG